MLIEAPPFYEINGVSLLRDHENERQFYYQPLAPRFVTRTDGGVEVPQLLLVKYRSEKRSGGLLDFDVHLGLSTPEKDAVAEELTRLSGVQDPILSPVPVTDGGISLMLLGAESGDVGGAGDPTFVRAIRHAAKPALYGDNRAAFSVELDERGVTILDKAMRGELAPIGVVYSLDYLALRPAYHVALTIDWDRTQDVLDKSHGFESLFTDAQISETVAKLVEDKVIQLDVTTFVPEGDDRFEGPLQRRDAALARVRDMITSAFFESSINPEKEPPDGWDKAAGIVKEFAPHRIAPLGLWTYKRQHHTRIDKKRLDVDFTEQITISRTMYPQGHLAGLFRTVAAGVDLSRLIIQVDADDPFFTRRKVTVSALSEFADTDPVREIRATLTYGGTSQTVRLNATTKDQPVEWPSTLDPDGRMVEPVDLRYELDLRPVDGGERPNTLSSETTQVPGESASIQPRDLFSEETIPVLTTPSFPFDRYPRVDVQLRYDDPAHGIRQDDVVRLDATTPNAGWRRFLVGPPTGPVQVRTVYRAADNRDVEQPFVELTRPQVDVADPFPDRLVVSLEPMLNPELIDRAFVDLEYRDDVSGVRVTDSIEVLPGQKPRPFQANRDEGASRHVRYRVTVVTKDFTTLEGPWSSTLGTRIFVRADQRGHRAVLLQAPDDFAAAELMRIDVGARARDDAAALSFTDAFQFAAGGASGVFEFDFVDPAKDAFELQIRRLFTNGLSTNRDWAPFDADVVPLTAT